jgi:cephalosporin hydroxylase
MGRLTEIANRNNTDKGTVYNEKHGYTELYDKYIPETGSYKLLEIGVWHGDSLRMWREYNPELDIHAVDIDPNVHRFVSGFNIHIGDQSGEEFMESVVEKSGPLDFIIDDGSHMGDHIVASFKILWKHVKPGGYYFIEDLHAGHARREDTIRRITEWLEGKDYTMTLTMGVKLLIIQKPL